MHGLLEQEDLTTADWQRAKIGAWLGLILGVAYGLIATTINAVVLWDVPMRFDLGATLFSMLLTGAEAAVVGYLTALPQASLRGVITGAVVMALFQTAARLFNLSGDEAQRFGLVFVLFILFLPLAALFLLGAVVLRLMSGWYAEALTYTGVARFKRLIRLWGGLLVILLVLANFSQLSPPEQAAARQTHALLQTVLAGKPMPSPLRSIDDLRARAAPGYVLEVGGSTDVSRDSAASSPVVGRYIQVTASFDNGLTIACLYGQGLGEPLCREQR